MNGRRVTMDEANLVRLKNKVKDQAEIISFLEAEVDRLNDILGGKPSEIIDLEIIPNDYSMGYNVIDEHWFIVNNFTGTICKTFKRRHNAVKWMEKYNK